MAAPLDSEDDVGSFLSMFELLHGVAMLYRNAVVHLLMRTRRRSSRTCGSGSIPRLRRRKPGLQMRGNTRSTRRRSGGC